MSPIGLISSLKSSGLLDSVRGSHGGYYLKKQFKEITLSEIVQALGGPITIIDCIGNPKTCVLQNECGLFEIWRELNEVIRDKLESITLSEIVEKKKAKIGNKNVMYYI